MKYSEAIKAQVHFHKTITDFEDPANFRSQMETVYINMAGQQIHEEDLTFGALVRTCSLFLFFFFLGSVIRPETSYIYI